MNKIILMIAMLVVSSSAKAEWVKVNTTRLGSVSNYVDKSSIQKTQYMVKMWRMTDSTKAINSNGLTFKSIKGQHEYNCNNRQFRTLYETASSGNMGEGISVYSAPGSLSWAPILLGSANEDFWKIACGKR